MDKVEIIAAIIIPTSNVWLEAVAVPNFSLWPATLAPALWSPARFHCGGSVGTRESGKPTAITRNEISSAGALFSLWCSATLGCLPRPALRVLALVHFI